MELFKPVAPDYEVSNLGNVRSFKSGKPVILKPRMKKGVPSVILFVDGKQLIRAIHRLVADAFIPNPDNLPFVRHKDGDPFNNRADNLYRTHRPHQGTPLLSADDVIYIRNNPDRLPGVELAKKFGVDQTLISKIRHGVRYCEFGGNILVDNLPRPQPVNRIPDDIRNEIRRLYVKGDSQFGARPLARKFNLVPGTVRNIVKEPPQVHDPD